MVVDDLDLFSAAIEPDKTNAPLVVDTDRMLTLSITLQCFETISWRSEQIFEALSLLDHRKFALGRSQNVGWESFGAFPDAIASVIEFLCDLIIVPPRRVSYIDTNQSQ